MKAKGQTRSAERGTAPPVVARVERGGRLESAHRADAATVDGDGRLVSSLGDPRRVVYIRSAGKPFQVLPLLEGGGERAFRLSDDEIAVMCASHGGEPRHVRVVARLLARGGFAPRDLACGAHWPMHEASARALIRRGQRMLALHNNCSGKHAGLLLACRLHGFSAAGYWRPEHPIQRLVLARLASLSGVPPSDIPVAVDGCSLPVFALSLGALAGAYARLFAVTLPKEGSSARAARRRVIEAMTRSPEMVAGKGRFTTDFLRVGGGRWVGKEGAEGVYAVGARAPGRGGAGSLGIALKIEDGSSRARDALTLAMLERAGLLTGSARSRLSSYRFPVLRNVRGLVVGTVRVEEPLGT